MERILIATLVACSILVACAPTQQAPPAASDYADLVAQLRSHGLRVVEADTIDQPFLTRRARVLRVNEEDIQVYEYEAAEGAATDAATVSDEGSSIGTTNVHWMAPPHFHRKERLIAIHIGVDPSVRDALTAIMGAQFAGQ